ncbi:50S ribosomal protein L7/L12 [Chlamydia abortus]|uniref:50S ribosomal protein L7/L12 n=1 Tax=Chlamydia abortus TaxID=83555 RepID=UPI0011170A64|nr:50S ribosomal protein L7/L12 [Chlamydia abortus]
MTTQSLETLVETLSSLTVLELSALKKLLEEKWDVTAAAPMMAVAAGAAGAGAGAEAAAAESTEFVVTLEEVPADKKIGVLKVVREVTGLALKEAKEMTEGLPKVVKEKTSKSDAEETVKKLQEAGAKASFKGL